jgi:hypothetical protein
MPRVARASAGGVCYHVLNRGNGGTKIFRTTRDYTDFVKLPRIDPGPVERGRNWLKSLQNPLTAEELALIRHSVVRGTPLGDAKWQQRIVAKLGLESTMRPRGRPRKTPVA